MSNFQVVLAVFLTLLGAYVVYVIYQKYQKQSKFEVKIVDKNEDGVVVVTSQNMNGQVTRSFYTPNSDRPVVQRRQYWVALTSPK